MVGTHTYALLISNCIRNTCIPKKTPSVAPHRESFGPSVCVRLPSVHALRRCCARIQRHRAGEREREEERAAREYDSKGKRPGNRYAML